MLENYPVTDETSSRPRYLDLKNFILDDIVWVDEVNGLLTATEYIEGCKIVGIDCEWKPNYEKGSKPNKVTFFLVESSVKICLLSHKAHSMQHFFFFYEICLLVPKSYWT